jgi:hypothetical protein
MKALSVIWKYISGHPIWSGAAATIIGGWVLGFFSGLKPMRDKSVELTGIAWNLAIQPVILPVLVPAMLVLLSAFCTWRWWKLINKNRADSKILRPGRFHTFDHYREDQFYDVIWRWNYKNEDEIVNLSSFCPQCDLEFDWKRGSRERAWMTIFFCEGCQKRFGQSTKTHIEIEASVKRLIEQKVRLVKTELRSKKGSG